MNKEQLIKFIGAFFSALVVLNFLFFVFGKISVANFWFILILCALVSFFGIPTLRKNLLQK